MDEPTTTDPSTASSQTALESLNHTTAAPDVRDTTTKTANGVGIGADAMVMALVELRSSVQGLNQDIAALSQTVESATRAVRTLDRKIGAVTLPLQSALFEYSENCQREIAQS